jgi:hypothetical protein
MREEADKIEQAADDSGIESGAMPRCGSCASTARRESARYCATCGAFLGGGYYPSDFLRASYHPGRKSDRHDHLKPSKRLDQVVPKGSSPLMPEQNLNNASLTALAFVTYAMVPYLGILFCPGAVVMGSIGLVGYRRAPKRGGRRASCMSIAFGLMILAVQVFLWWILYKVPQWSKGI